MRELSPLVVFLGGAGLVAALLIALGWRHLNEGLPDVATLAGFEPPEATILTDRNGVVLAEIYSERRYIVPLDAVPVAVRNAFIAAEDGSFLRHGGVDYFGILRATWRNTREGRSAQGASTITQQVVRHAWLTREKTWERKLREIILARRVEGRYDKDFILGLYLNTVYLGAQAYGVEAAARTFFGKSVGELDLAQAALLAGLPQRPSDYNPLQHFDRAKARQRYVLDQMVERGLVDLEAARRAEAADVHLLPAPSRFVDRAPSFTEEVRRGLVQRYGEDRVTQGGLRVTTTCDLGWQEQAQSLTQAWVTRLDRRTGFRRDTVPTLPDAASIRRWRTETEVELGGEVDEVDHLLDGPVYPAVVLTVAADRATVGIGDHLAALAIEDHRWIAADDAVAHAFTQQMPVPESERDAYSAMWAAYNAAVLIDPATPRPEYVRRPILRVGDVVRVTLESTHPVQDRRGRSLPRAHLHQPIELEAAMLAMDLGTGAVRTLIGGANRATSQFNRATQARRQVGSTFKPIVYAAAIDAGKATAATPVLDVPVSIPLADGTFWRPQNYGNDYAGTITVRRAVAESRNVAAVRMMMTMDEGMNGDLLHDFARRLGLGGPDPATAPTAPGPTTDTLCPWIPETPHSTVCMDRTPPKPAALTDAEHRAALGPGSPYLCRACDYSVGLGSVSLSMEEMVRAYSVFGTHGYLVEPYYIEEVRDRHGKLLDGAPARAKVPVVVPEVADIVHFVLEGPVEDGTAHDARKLGVPVAGKTGTTNEGKDAWFIGMTSEVITGVWLGFDQPRTLGEKATGGRLALPLWLQYMRLLPKPATEFVMSPKLQWADVDEWSGYRVPAGTWGKSYPFLPGTMPRVGLPRDPEAPPAEMTPVTTPRGG